MGFADGVISFVEVFPFVIAIGAGTSAWPFALAVVSGGVGSFFTSQPPLCPSLVSDSAKYPDSFALPVTDSDVGVARLASLANVGVELVGAACSDGAL